MSFEPNRTEGGFGARFAQQIDLLNHSDSNFVEHIDLLSKLNKLSKSEHNLFNLFNMLSKMDKVSKLYSIC